jgi:hypothetical protein
MTISKRTRFGVFKRDGFKCQYCGKTPPSVILEVDHINPKSKGGDNDILNYITACLDCNRGKGAIPLDQVPPALNDKITEMTERREQVNAYTEFLESIERQTEIELESVNLTFNKYFPSWRPCDSYQTSIKLFLRHLPAIKVRSAMDTACSRWYGKDNGHNRSLPYFCGICWNWIKYPEMRDW